MKKIIFTGMIAAILIFSSCDIIDALFDGNSVAPVNVLRNTTWVSNDSDINTLGALSMLGGGPGIFEIITIDFGDGNFSWRSDSNLFGFPMNTTSNGRYTISGTNVTLTLEGETLYGEIIGNTMQIGNLSFRRSQ